jgi:hypothetical protein
MLLEVIHSKQVLAQNIKELIVIACIEGPCSVVEKRAAGYLHSTRIECIAEVGLSIIDCP